ncbi:MAG: biopolymer transporter ExbD [Sneathiellaceae bacterium]
MVHGPTPWPAQARPPAPAAALPPAVRRVALTAGRARRRSLISLTPLIDMVFILLVFFMLASTFTDWNAIPFALSDTPQEGRPAGSADRPAERQPDAGAVLLDVGRDQLRLSGRPVGDAELPARLAALQAGPRGQAGPDAGRRVIVRPAAGVPLQRLVAVMDMLAAAGVTDLSLARRGEGR